MFTNTREFLGKIKQDPLRLRSATARLFWQSRRLDELVDDEMPKNTRPLLLFLAGRDQIIDNPAVEQLLRRGAQKQFHIHTYEDQTHSIQFDAPERLVADMLPWLASHQ